LITQPNKKGLIFFLDSAVFDRFCAVDNDSLLGFFPALQDFEIMGLSSVKNGICYNI
jgi:hypothetical protein